MAKLMETNHKSIFDDIRHCEVLTPPEVFTILKEYRSDPDPKRVNLGIGAYRTDEGLPWILPSVKAAKVRLDQDPKIDHEYGAVMNIPGYQQRARELLFGAKCPALLENRVGTYPTVAGSVAIRLAMDFLHAPLSCRTVYTIEPSWGNEIGITRRAGFKDIQKLRYWDDVNQCLDFSGMIAQLRKAEAMSAVIFHMCCHNPTGMDPTLEQWKQICDVIKERKLIPVMDCAYQGFATGCPETDAAPLRLFVEEGLEMFVVQTFSKIFGLYAERVGNLHYVCKDTATMDLVTVHMARIDRETFSGTSVYGPRLVNIILEDPQLKTQWLENLKEMSNRVNSMRHLFYEKLRDLGTPGPWENVIKQRGLFSYTVLQPHHVDYLKAHYHIYLLQSGRLVLSCMTSKNIDYIASAIHDVMTRTFT